jgi:hypothetical protein
LDGLSNQVAYKYFGQFLSKTFPKTEVSGKYEIGDLAVVEVSGG